MPSPPTAPPGYQRPPRPSSPGSSFRDQRFKGCWHCGDEGHPKTKCNEFLDILKNNGGKLPSGYMGKYAKWMENQRKKQVAVVQGEGDVEQQAAPDAGTKSDDDGSDCPSSTSERRGCHALTFLDPRKPFKPRLVHTVQKTFTSHNPSHAIASPNDKNSHDTEPEIAT